MPILLLITDLELGGSPTVVRELAIRLRKQGEEIEVACLSKWGPVADQLRDAGVPVTALNARGVSDLRILPRLISLTTGKKFTTVFSFLMHANALAAAASVFVREVRWIQSIQTTQPKPGWHWLMQRIANHAAERIVVPSPSVACIATEWSGIAPEKIVIIPNAIDLADWRAHSPIPAADPRPYPVTFLGRLDPVKDVPTLVTAVAQLNRVATPSRSLRYSEEPDGMVADPGLRSTSDTGSAGNPLVHLHIYGDGADRKRIENTIASTKASATLHGEIATPQAALSQSGLLVLPSLAEGFGLVLIEAMAAGVPVIATDVPGIRDVVRHEHTGLLVPPSEPEALATAIRRVIEDRPLRERLILNAAEEVRTRFTWQSILPLYQQLLK